MALSAKYFNLKDLKGIYSGEGETPLADYAFSYKNQMFGERNAAEEKWKNKQKEVVRDYYRLTSLIYKQSCADNLHFAPTMPWDDWESCTRKQNYRIAIKLEAKSTDKIVEFGCGMGGPSRDIAEISYAHVTGINVCKNQLDHCRRKARELRLGHLLDYVEEDFSNLSIAANTFDKLYTIEATCHVPDATLPYGEAFRVLKHGGLAVLHEWALTNKFDKENERHMNALERFKYGTSLPGVRTKQENTDALKEVGFEILEEEDYAEFGLNSPEAWYKGSKEPRYLYFLIHVYCWFLWLGERIGILPKGGYDAWDIMVQAAVAVNEMGELGIATPMQMIVARKPKAK